MGYCTVISRNAISEFRGTSARRLLTKPITNSARSLSGCTTTVMRAGRAFRVPRGSEASRSPTAGTNLDRPALCRPSGSGRNNWFRYRRSGFGALSRHSEGTAFHTAHAPPCPPERRSLSLEILRQPRPAIGPPNAVRSPGSPETAVPTDWVRFFESAEWAKAARHEEFRRKTHCRSR